MKLEYRSFLASIPFGVSRTSRPGGETQSLERMRPAIQTLVFLILLTVGLLSSLQAQGVFCNPLGNVMIFSNYDGGQLNINVDSNISNLKIGVLSSEAVTINITGAYAANVTGVIYAGSNGASFNCSNSPSSTTVSGVSSSIVTQHTPPTLAAATLTDPNGNANMLCAFQCNSGPQSGCNTPAQIVDYFLTQFGGDLLFHYTQFNCWNQNSYALSGGGNCCVGAPAFVPFDLGADTSLCNGTSLLLDANVAGATSYAWNTGSTTPSINVITEGTYTVTTYFGNTIYIDSIHVDYDLIQLQLPDTVELCAGDTNQQSVFHPTANYLWSDGSTGPDNNFTQGGMYSVSVSIGGCIESDSVTVVPLPAPSIELGADTQVCANSNYALKVINAVGWTYLWQDGSSNAAYEPQSTGSYAVTVTSAIGCTASDTTHVQLITPQTPNLGPDTSICEGEFLLLAPVELGTSYQWSTGAIDNQIQVLTSGTYTVSITDTNSCVGIDSLALDVLPAPSFDFGEGQREVYEDTFVLEGPAGFQSYLWTWETFSSTAESIEVVFGPFSISIDVNLEVEADNGCSATDQITLSRALPQGVDEIAEEEVLAYPNPFSSVLTLEGLPRNEPITYRLTSLHGQLIRSASITTPSRQLQLHLEDVPAGTYFLQWNSSDQGGVLPLVKSLGFE